jgi:hypothetical protein
MKNRELTWLIAILTILFSACQKETLDLNQRSKKIEIERVVNLPLVKGNISFDDLLNIEPDTLEIIDLLDTLEIYYNLEFDYQDTIQVSKMDSNITIDYMIMYYWFTNEFPLGLDVKMYMYDSTNAEIIDSILFSSDPSEIFLPAAPVDSTGLIIQDEIEEKAGEISISSSQAANLFEKATDLILITHIQANTLSIIKIPATSFLHFKLSIDARGKYETYQE